MDHKICNGKLPKIPSNPYMDHPSAVGISVAQFKLMTARPVSCCTRRALRVHHNCESVYSLRPVSSSREEDNAHCSRISEDMAEREEKFHDFPLSNNSSVIETGLSLKHLLKKTYICDFKIR